MKKLRSWYLVPSSQQMCVCVCACVCVSHFSHVQLLAMLCTEIHQVPLSMAFLRQEYRNGLPFLSPGDLPDPEIKPASFMSPALAGGFFTTSVTWQIRGGKVEVVTDFISRAPKSPQMVTAATKLKTLSSWKKSYDKHRKHIKKQ